MLHAQQDIIAQVQAVLLLVNAMQAIIAQVVHQHLNNLLLLQELIHQLELQAPQIVLKDTTIQRVVKAHVNHVL